jgi:hypothetical protein
MVTAAELHHTMKHLVAPSSAVGWLIPLLVIAGLELGCSPEVVDEPGAGAGASAGGTNATGGATTSSSGTGSTGSAGSSAGTSGDVRGSVVVSLAPPSDDAPGYSTLIARFFAGPTPDPFPLRLDSEQAGCQLLVPDLPFCSESCSPDVCTADDECTSYPAPLNVGKLTVNGLGAPLMLAPATSMVVYQSPSLAYPPCPEGMTVDVSAAGFALEAECIAPLTLTGPDPIPVKAGASVHVSWQPSTEAGSARIRIGLDVSHHGGKKGQIDCDVPDTGTFDIPEPLVTKLVGLGLAGYPTIAINRVSLGVDADNPEVSLVLSSAVTRAVDTGVISCQDDVECPDGQTCQMVGICD